MNYFKSILNNRFKKDILFTIAFGVLSLIFQFIYFNIPGVKGVQSDLRELPLLIAIIHLSNPFYSIGLSAISSINFSLSLNDYFHNFIGHAIPLFILWYFFNMLNRQQFNIVKNAIASVALVLIYYLISIQLALISFNGFIVLTSVESYTQHLSKLFVGVQYEMTYTAIAISFYYVQHKLRIELQNHQQALEKTVNERTEHLHVVIEELKKAQNHLVQSEKMASLGTLVTGVAHEINNPLNFISGGIHIMKDIKPEIEKSVSDELKESYTLATNIINEGFDRSVDIVNALMSFSIKGESRKEYLNIHSIIDNTLLFMMSIIPKDIVISKEFALAVPVPVYVEKLHQIFINLFNNAVFALNSDRIKEKMILIKTSRKDNSAVIEISNSGPPIAEEHLSQIFDPFFTTKDPDKGKGLGLSICYTYINEHKGKISAVNIENSVKFIIELPLND
ncbi:MAG TPA: ATP-binding protein [Bacteroidales bacterium]|nr:ATP-binding protein [Bacteroidales bacterium]